MARQLLLRGKDAAALAAADTRLQLHEPLDLIVHLGVVLARARHARSGRAIERRLAREAAGAARKGGRERAGRGGAGYALRRCGITLAQRAALLLGGRRVGQWRGASCRGVVDAAVAREAAGGGAAPRVLPLRSRGLLHRAHGLGRVLVPAGHGLEGGRRHGCLKFGASAVFSSKKASAHAPAPFPLLPPCEPLLQTCFKNTAPTNYSTNCRRACPS